MMAYLYAGCRQTVFILRRLQHAAGLRRAAAVALFVAMVAAVSAARANPSAQPNATVTSGAPASSATAMPPGAGELMSIVEAGRLADLRWPDFTSKRTEVKEFYQAGGYALAWSAGGKPIAQALAMIQQFKAADFKGLNPEDYDASRWDGRVARLAPASPTPAPADVVHFDIAMTVCAMRYISDLHIGRINPRHFKFDLGAGPQQIDLSDFVRTRLLTAGDIPAAVASVERSHAGYRRAEAALAQYLKLAAQGDGAPVPAPPRTIRPGDTFAGMPQLVRRLYQLGDLVSLSDPAAQTTLYQGVVVDAVKHFQVRHGLEPDGLLGKATVAQLNVPLKHRVMQLDFALERYRWLPPDFPQPPI